LGVKDLQKKYLPLICDAGSSSPKLVLVMKPALVFCTETESFRLLLLFPFVENLEESQSRKLFKKPHSN
jgi:hypothetical protein